MWAIGSKKKPKSHLGILKEEKDQKRVYSFHESLREGERAREEGFHFPEKESSKKGTNFEVLSKGTIFEGTTFIAAGWLYSMAH